MEVGENRIDIIEQLYLWGLKCCIIRVFDLRLQPLFFQQEGMFIVSPHPLKATEKIAEKGTEKILQLINKRKSITIKELAKKIGVSTSAIDKQIRKLKDKNKIEPIGADKGGYWKILQLKHD